MARRKALPDLTPISQAFEQLAEEVKAYSDGKAQIIGDLLEIVRRAHALIESLGGVVHPLTPSSRGGRPRGYQASEETKAKLRAAWKRRRTQAEVKRKVVRVLSPEARERIAAAQRKRWADARKK